MDKISKKEIRKVVADLIESSLHTIKLSNPSDKTKESIIKLSRKFASVLHDEIKKQVKQKKKDLKKINENPIVKTIKTIKKKNKVKKTK